MPRDEELPNLDSALEKSFSEMKIGEDKFEKVKEDVVAEVGQKYKIEYGRKFSSENQKGSFTVKPTTATKSIIDKPLDISNEDEIIENVGEKGEKKVVEILDKPSTSLGDDFEVEW